MEYDKKAIGYRIKTIRKSLGLTLEQFGSLIDNSSKSNVSKWESGVSIPNNKRLKLISTLGKISTNELLYGSVETMVKNKIDELVSSNEYKEKLSKFNNETINLLKKRIYKSYFEYTLIGYDENLLINLLDNSVELLNIGIDENTNVNAVSYLINELEKHTNINSDYRAFFVKGNNPSKKYVRENMDFEVYKQTQGILINAVNQLRTLRDEQLEKERTN